MEVVFKVHVAYEYCSLVCCYCYAMTGPAGFVTMMGLINWDESGCVPFFCGRLTFWLLLLFPVLY